MNINEHDIIQKVSDTLIRAATTFREDQKAAFQDAINRESNPQSKWVLESYLENAIVAEKNKIPLCDDTGIPHLLLELGDRISFTSHLLGLIQLGIAEGLKKLPGRPMAVKGNDVARLEQSHGLYEDPSQLAVAPIQIRTMSENGIRVNIVMQGGGPEIRAKTFRVFHQHKISVIIDEIVSWASEGASQLGCTPCTPAIGIGRSHMEATSLMLEAMVNGKFNIQSDIENQITARLNKTGIGSLGLTGSTTAMATFLKIGPQRASGVRIVALRLCCGVEPRVANCLLT